MGWYVRTFKRLGRLRWVAALGPRIVAADRKLQVRTRGRRSLMGRSFNPMLLTTTGRRSGEPRVSPLIYAAVDGGYVVAGTNFGQRHHPAWSGNLLAEPAATISIDGRETAVRARLVEDQGPERDRLWAAMTALWPAYDEYAGRAGRPIRLFLLAPVADEANGAANGGGPKPT
ncbi:nitroreductase family deazaflavin-dependent oxidoreductase [Yinghuangia soli]|uniref:Nitroreductase family deazaflavin-dependent oxidoreductase n=1 Tax=Yinghuangia soli TaxID=2908204 RepID=A0AA41Q6I5_9ACTN|nr:nitroreductase family deazaflavin-dependent oxidoreductase [Yinghuangia soli]MCF2532181.1 nitroreductase family deazaflavin-dependent oxidoreductase [Yinghuangia soli]